MLSCKLEVAKCAFRLGENAVLTRSRGAMLNYPHVVRAFRGSGNQANPGALSRAESENYVYAERWISTSQSIRSIDQSTKQPLDQAITHSFNQAILTLV